MTLNEDQVAKIQQHLAAIHRILAGHPAHPRDIAAWVSEHLTWQPSSRVLCTDAAAQASRDLGRPVTSKQLAPYVPWPRQRSNGHTYYLHTTLR